MNLNLFQLLFPDFSLIVCGYFLCKYTKLNRKIWEPVESLVYFFLFPVLLFSSIARSPLDIGSTSNFISAGICLAAGAIGLSYSLPFIPFLKRFIDARAHASSAQIGFRFNSFIAFALALQLGGAQAQQLVALLIGICVPCFNIGAVWPMHRYNIDQSKRTSFAHELLKNPLILATIGGVAFNLTGFQLPHFTDAPVTRIGQAAVALGLLTAGAGMQLRSLTQNKTLGICVLAIKHVGMPVLAALFVQVFALKGMQAQVMMMFSALPTASSSYVLAARMGFNGPYVAALMTLSTLLSIISLSVVLHLF
jgi:hypothetical protein